MKRHLAPALVCAAALLSAAATERSLTVLTVGNSFADNACAYLPQIAESVPGCQIRIIKANIGGCSLEKHAALIKECEADPKLRPYAKKDSLKTLLQKERYDVITVQQVSHQSFRPESYQPHAAELTAFIRQHAPDAEVVVHQTWAYAPDSGRLDELQISRDRMHAGLVACYATLAQSLGGVRLLRSGEAFYSSHRDNPGIDLWNARDRFHASRAGCYLAGCVWFGELFGVSPEKVAFVPEGLTQEEAATLRRTAASRRHSAGAAAR
jgi:hypothetical protein